MDNLARLFANVLLTTKFRCSCPSTITQKTDIGSHIIRICDPNFYNSHLIDNLQEAIKAVSQNFNCKGPWTPKYWAIAPTTRAEAKERSDLKVILETKPQLYPNFFDITTLTGTTNQEIVEYLQYIIPATNRRGLVLAVLPNMPSKQILESIIRILSPMDVFTFEDLHIVMGQPLHSNVTDKPLSIYQSTKLEQIMNTLEYASLHTVSTYGYGWDIFLKTSADPKAGIDPVTRDNFDPKELPAHLVAESAWTNEKYFDDIFDTVTHNKLNPIEPLLAGHLGLLLPVGYLNNKVIYDKNETKDPIVIKGSVEKFEQIVEEHTNKIVTEESYEIRITTMNLKTGEINQVGQKDNISLPEFLQDNQTALYKTAKTLFPPSVDYTHDNIDIYMNRMRTLKRAPVGKQGATIISLASHIHDNKNAFCIGQQGSGKTFIALGITTALNYNKVLVICPTHAVETWRREIKETIANAVVLKPSGISGTKHTKTEIPLDKIKDLPCDNPTFIILPKDISKLGFSEKLNIRKSTLYRNQYGKVRSSAIKNIDPERLPKTCPHCNDEQELTPIKIGKEYTISCPQCEFPKEITCTKCWQPIQDARKMLATKKITKKIYCTSHIATHHKPTNRMRFTRCNALLTSPDTDARFHHRVAYGEYIAKYLPQWHDIFIIDELHQYKGKDSLQTMVAGKIAQKAKKTLGLTGTFMGGYAANLYWLFEHFIPRFPNEGLEWNRETKFIELFGKYRHTYKMSRTQFDRMMVGLTRKQTGQRTQIPGYHPELLKFILPTSVFVKIYDINRELLAPRIYAKIIPLDTENTFAKGEVSINQHDAYFKLKTALEINATERVNRGENYNVLSLIHELVTYPENCWQGIEPIDPSTEKTIIKLPEILLKEEKLFPKEEELVKIIQEEIVVQKRKCLIYCTHTNEKATWTRIVQILNNHPLLPNVKCAFMPSKGAAETRLARLESLAEKNDVVIIQPQAVETGLNLQQFPTIIWYEPHLSIYTSEQASARSHRINQDKEVRIYYLVYAGTYQERQLRLLADKRDVSSTITGVINEDSLSSLNAKQLNLREILAKEFHENYKFTDERSIDERAAEITELFNQQREELTQQIEQEDMTLLDDSINTVYENIVQNSSIKAIEHTTVKDETEHLIDIELIESAALIEPLNITDLNDTAYQSLLKTAGQQGSLF